MKEVIRFGRATNQIVPAYRTSFEKRATIWTFACGCILGQRRSPFGTFEFGKFDFVDTACGDPEHERTLRNLHESPGKAGS
jgi:hypothetical protein